MSEEKEFVPRFKKGDRVVSCIDYEYAEGVHEPAGSTLLCDSDSYITPTGYEKVGILMLGFVQCKHLAIAAPESQDNKIKIPENCTVETTIRDGYLVYEFIPELEDKQEVEFWDTKYPWIRRLGFYDKVNDSVFSANGARYMSVWENIIPIPKAKIPDWMKEAKKNLKD